METMVTMMEERRTGEDRRKDYPLVSCSNRIFYSTVIVILLILFFVAIVNFKTQTSIDSTLSKVAPVPEINRVLLIEIQTLQKKMEIVQNQQSILLEYIKETHKRNK